MRTRAAEAVRRLLGGRPRPRPEPAPIARSAGNRILLTGWESTGSTFVYQVLERLGVEVEKRHGSQDVADRRILFTIRDPRDVICSRSRRFYAEEWRAGRSEPALLRALEDFAGGGNLEALDDALTRPNVWVIRYETYFGGREAVLVRMLADTFCRRLPEYELTAILEVTSSEANRKRAERFADFEAYDPESKIHGRHITSGGQIGVWRDLFTPRVAAEVSRQLGPALKRLGYGDSPGGEGRENANDATRPPGTEGGG